MTTEDPRAKALDEIDLEQFEDFESFDLDEDSEADDRNDFVSGMWGRYGFTGRKDTAEAIVTAHKMVQGFVDTFSTDQLRYRVAFDPTLSTAGTDMDGYVVAITPSPLFDKTLTAEQAAIILTAMATHEISHPRYGRSTAAAVRRVFGQKRAPNTLSNLLDDVRIEKRFVADYPGYRDIFRPMIEYVAAGAGRKRNAVIRPSMLDLVNLAIVAIRYSAFVEWKDDEVKEERAWWQAWADRWAREDAPRRHVDGVREGLKRIVMAQERRKARARRQGGISPDTYLPPEYMRVKTGLESLTPIARKAMRLTAEGLNGEQIAATLGLSLVDTKILIRSARRKMTGEA